MIGFYDYTVVVTYISLVSSIMGIFCAIEGRVQIAVFCLAFSGLCDMFDGKIARTKKKRTEDEKSFGIQIDSLCDIVCFGIFPVVLAYKLGMNHFYSVIILAFYGLAGVIRLAYFNVMETRRQSETSENRKYYQGLHIAMFLVGLLFIVDFRFRKPTNKELVVLVAVVSAAVLVVLFYKGGAWWKYHQLAKLKALKGCA